MQQQVISQNQFVKLHAGKWRLFVILGLAVEHASSARAAEAHTHQYSFSLLRV